MTVAVLGANGFIGNRAVELLQTYGLKVRPIVRRASAAALPRRYDVDVQVAEATDRAALGAAFEGCDTVFVSVAGAPATIVGVIEPIYLAARDARIRRLIYLSSASVHGQAPEPGTDERSPLSARQPLAYNNAKVLAERRLAALAKAGGPETVVLRPGIVFGPRSHWVGGWADELLAGEAYVVGGARGLCNAIYVDDLVRAALLAMRASDVHGKAYLLGQREQVTWRDLDSAVATALGINIERVPDYPFEAALPEPRHSALTRTRPLARRLKAAMPKSVRVGARAALRHRAASRTRDPTRPAVSMERALLHTARYIPRWTLAQAELGYEPEVAFDEGLRRSIAWLSFAGYPVAARWAS
ncbi:NAD-dependent epimerase/dehydratase family protein [Phenylobacterium sp.]|jgi:nucleoside-diphosphate-sugar epimerase|uniref:NAD-dependent epimerase/dehydratase family protein n=1 Tax=Phenylobacterium sp. TaxID=1871053 RepID=UPI003782F6E4